MLKKRKVSALRGEISGENPAVTALMNRKAALQGQLPPVGAKKLKHASTPLNEAIEALDELFLQVTGRPSRRRYLPIYQPVKGGSSDAIHGYVRIICEHVTKLNGLIETHRNLVLPISRKSLSWPMLISKRKIFGDDPDHLIRAFQVGADTIANDSAARFNPKQKFGRIAWDIIQRIERCRTTPKEYFTFQLTISNCVCGWAAAARQLPPFSRTASAKEKKQWLKVVEQVLESDFSDRKLTAEYRCLVTAPSHQKRWKAVFHDKVRGEFDSIWRIHAR